MPRPSLGDQELELLRFVADRNEAGVSAGEAAAGFAEPNGLARSTVETVLERLRKKGFLSRNRRDGAFRYTVTIAPRELMAGLVGKFIEQTLAGSLTPFVHYFSQQNRLSESEVKELERIVAKLQTQQEDATNVR